MAGETALARQLKKLAVPQTSLLIQDKIRKSFLFDHRDAAGLDRDIIFAYGTTGLEKLTMINPMFTEFESNLFSANLKDFQRAVQSHTANKRLDIKIEEFLRILSPYFLTRAAHEALEWLIYRFHIHLYNADALVESVLPHFNTSSFVRVVQLLNLDDPSNRWAWLLPVQKSGVHIEYSAIINRFIADRGFRKIVCDIAPKYMNVFKVGNVSDVRVVTFSMLTVYSALGKARSVTDEMITFLLPYILKGLSSDINEYISATYLVISRIMMNVKLTDELVNQLLMKVFENVKMDLMMEACELLLLTYQQQSIKKLPKDLFKLLLSQNTCLKQLVYLSENYEATPLTTALIKVSVASLFLQLNPKNLKKKSPKLERKRKKLLKFCIKIIQLVSLDEKTITVYFNAVLNNYSKFQKKSDVKNLTLKKVAIKLLKGLESKYSENFDKAIDSFFKKKKDDNKNHLCDLINESVCSLKNKILQKKQTTLVLGINHPHHKVRTTSVKYLLKQAASKKMSDIKFVESSLSERLLDDSCDVVEQVLSSPKILLKYLDRKEILSRFERILKKKENHNSPWYSVQMTCLDILCDYFYKEEDLAYELFVTLLPFIFPLKKTTAPGFLRIVKSELGTILPVIKVLSIAHEVEFNGESDNDQKQLVQLNNTVIISLRKYIEDLSDSAKSSFLSFLMEKCMASNYPPLLTIYVFASAHAIISKGQLDEKFTWTESLLSFLNTFPRPDVSIDEFDSNLTEETVIQRCVQLLWKNHLPGVVIFNEFNKIVTATKLECPVLISNAWLVKCNPLHHKAFKILTLIFEFCVQHIDQGESLNSKSIFINNLKTLFKIFIESQFQSPECLFGFLSLLWSDVFKDVPVLLQVQALKTANDSMNTSNNFDWYFENEVLFHSLLKAISSPHPEVQNESLNLLDSLLQCLSKEANAKCALKSFAEAVRENREEINTDHTQFYVLSNNWLEPSFELYENQDTVHNSVLKHKHSVLDSYMKLLLDENTPNSMRNHLLLCLERADNVNILSALIPLIENFLRHFQSNKDSTDEFFFSCLGLLLKKFTAKTASCLLDQCAATETLFKCLQFVEQGNTNYIQMIRQILPILSRHFFTAIPSVEVQKRILDILLNAYIVSATEINSEIKKVLGKLSIFAYLFLRDFQDKEDSTQISTIREVKKSRTKEILDEDSNVFESRPWKKVTVLLEMIQNKSKLENCKLLIPELFNLLNKTFNFNQESSFEYLRQLILSTIYNCCQLLGTDFLEQSQFKVEFIVQCIRDTKNPKTHYQSLLLLNLAATMFPDYVLYNVMSLFTFMGNNLIRQDNSYSFQVISQTIETIVPALLEASRQRNENDAISEVAAFIRVFVSSISDIPRHRQLPLFTKLITTLDPSQFLWVCLGQICDHYASAFPDMTSQHIDEWKFSPTLDFAVNLHKQFSPEVQIDTCINLLNFLSILPDFKDSLGVEEAQNIAEPFNVSSHSDQQLQIYKYNVLSYINVWLSSRAFVSQVSELRPNALNKLEEKYEVLLEKVLNYLQHQQSLKMDNRNRHGLLPLLIDLIGHVNSLLPCNLFIRVVQRLLKNSDPVIQKKAIELLSCKLEQQAHLFKVEENRMSLIKLLRPLLKIFQSSDKELDSSVINQQTALYALHLLTKVVGSEYSAKFHKVLNITIQILKDNSNEELTVNALLCLAQLCSSMNVQVLPQLNIFMPIIVNFMTSDNILDMSDCLILGVVTALMSLVENLGVFLSSYMPSLVTSICKLFSKYQEVNKKVVHERLLSFQTMLAKDIDLRILLTAIEDSYSQIFAKDPDSVIPLMKMLEEKLTCCSYTDIEACSSQLQQFFITLLDFRNHHCHKFTSTHQSIDPIEIGIFSALRTFVLKVSVIHFQGFFKKVYLWVTATETKLQQRLFTFYGLTKELSKSLKNLFVVVAKTFLKHAASELDNNNTSKKEIAELVNQPQHLNNIMDTLDTCFVNDDGHLLDKDSFETLLQPLVDQLENVGNDEKVYQDRVSRHLSSCLAHFMNAVSDNALWKKLNYQILLKTRHDLPVVRFAAIQVIREVVTVMGDNYLVLLAESIPFLAEVMEDENAEVEHECQLVIAEMEKILGEPIKKYF